MVKNNWVSLLALVISVVAVILVSFHVEVTITHETFIGIMASFMGAAATIIVGAQIYNTIEARRLMNDIRDQQNRLDTNVKEAYKAIGSIDTKIENVNSRIAEFDTKMDIADSKFNDIYSLAAFYQGVIVVKERPMEAYRNFIDALYWGLGSEQKSAIEPCFNYMNNMVEELEEMLITRIVIQGWDIQLDKIPVSLNLLKKHPKYGDLKQRFEIVENRCDEIVDKIHKL